MHTGGLHKNTKCLGVWKTRVANSGEQSRVVTNNREQSPRQFSTDLNSLNLIDHQELCFLQHTSHMDICHLTHNPSEEPLVMLLWRFSRSCCTLLLILSSHHSAQNREENHDTNNFWPELLGIRCDDSKSLSMTFSLPWILLKRQLFLDSTVAMVFQAI